MRQLPSVLPALLLVLLVVLLLPALPAVRQVPLSTTGIYILYHIVCQACHCPEVSCTDNTAVVTGGVGGVMGLIILIQSVAIVVLLLLKASKRSQQTNKSAAIVLSVHSIQNLH